MMLQYQNTAYIAHHEIVASGTAEVFFFLENHYYLPQWIIDNIVNSTALQNT